MTNEYHYLSQLTAPADPIPKDSILSRTLLEKPGLKTILFNFASGQELSQHTASVPAVIHFLEGQADLTLGEDQREAQPGTWVYLPAKLPHSISAKTEVVMMLYLLER